MSISVVFVADETKKRRKYRLIKKIKKREGERERGEKKHNKKVVVFKAGKEQPTTKREKGKY